MDDIHEILGTALGSTLKYKSDTHTMKWILSKEKLKDCSFLMLCNSPMSISHGDLIQVCQQRCDQWIRWAIGCSHSYIVFSRESVCGRSGCDPQSSM